MCGLSRAHLSSYLSMDTPPRCPERSRLANQFPRSMVKTVHLNEERPYDPLPCSPDILCNGSCHCRNFQYQLKKPGEESKGPWPWEVKEDNCSSCVRVRSNQLYTQPSTVTDHYVHPMLGWFHRDLSHQGVCCDPRASIRQYV